MWSLALPVEYEFGVTTSVSLGPWQVGRAGRGGDGIFPQISRRAAIVQGSLEDGSPACLITFNKKPGHLEHSGGEAVGKPLPGVRFLGLDMGL